MPTKRREVRPAVNHDARLPGRRSRPAGTPTPPPLLPEIAGSGRRLRPRLGGHLGHSSLAVSVSLGRLGSCADACFLASFLACFSSRRSTSLRSRLSFAIVVFLLAVDAILTSRCFVPGGSMTRRTCAHRVGAAGAARVPRLGESCRPAPPRRALDRLDVRGCWALGALLGVIAHFRALDQ
jgi:hypothetical protein